MDPEVKREIRLSVTSRMSAQEGWDPTRMAETHQQLPHSAYYDDAVPGRSQQGKRVAPAIGEI